MQHCYYYRAPCLTGSNEEKYGVWDDGERGEENMLHIQYIQHSVKSKFYFFTLIIMNIILYFPSCSCLMASCNDN